MINFFKNIKKSKKGMTLIEVLVSMSIFAVLSVSLVNLFTSAMNTQAAILQNQELINQTGYAMEYMHKALRMADRDVPGTCTGVANSNYGADGTKTLIKFLAFDYSAGGYRCMEFSLSAGIIKVRKSTDATDDAFGSYIDLTSSKITVSTLNFAVDGDTVNIGQPKVTIMVDAVSTSKRVNPIPRLTLQTTASQRNLNIAQ
ncbi:MAG: prepilin-type N-terminal cleavage/methylation domain-containing protein [Candidatus Paceibacterota bacterium]